jgi:hypothetical protein
MHLSTQGSNQLHTIFGGGYVPEQHGDETNRYLPPSEHREFTLNFEDVLKALRAALSLR